MNEFFLKLLGNNTGVSSRRFIALITLPFLLFAIFTGVQSESDFKFGSAIFSALLLILLTYYSLSWEHVKEILTGVFSKKEQTQNFDT